MLHTLSNGRGKPVGYGRGGVSGVDFSRYVPGELVASYRDDDVYLFNVRDYNPDPSTDVDNHVRAYVWIYRLHMLLG